MTTFKELVEKQELDVKSFLMRDNPDDYGWYVDWLTECPPRGQYVVLTTKEHARSLAREKQLAELLDMAMDLVKHNEDCALYTYIDECNCGLEELWQATGAAKKRMMEGRGE